MSTELDQKVALLFEKLEAKKAEITKAEKPKWETNCSYKADSSSTSTNIQAVSDVGILVTILANLKIHEWAWYEACSTLGVKLPFKHQSYTIDEWLTDIQTRINKLEIDNKKAELKALEDKINLVVSPEQRRALEIAAIEKSLGL